MTTHNPTSVAFFLPHFNAGGIERVVHNLLIHLDRSRFSPTLILRARTGSLLGQLPSDLPVYDLGGKPIRSSILPLAAALKLCRAQVVYSGTNAANLGLLASSFLMRRGPAMVISEHTMPAQYLEEAKWRRLRLGAMRRLYRRASTVAVPTDDIGAELKSILRAPALPIVTLANPVIDLSATERVHPLPALMTQTGAPIFVTAGRFVPAKAFDVLCSAFARLRTNYPGARLIILGDGPERTRLAGLIESLGQTRSIELPGMVDDPISYFRHATAVVLSSRREGFGNVLVEAMAAGAPVIATDCSPGPRGIVMNGEAGLLVPPEDPAALAGAMARLLENGNLRALLSHRGRARAADFDVRRTLPAFEQLFGRLAAATAARPTS